MRAEVRPQYAAVHVTTDLIVTVDPDATTRTIVYADDEPFSM